jgi:hypothetical protein
MHHAVIAIEEQAGDRITVLVNNAGSLRAIGPLWEVDPEDWWLDVRPVSEEPSSAAARSCPLIRLGEGRIVNLTSYVAVRPTPYQTGYAAEGRHREPDRGARGLARGKRRQGLLGGPGVHARDDPQPVEPEAGKRWLPDVGRSAMPGRRVHRARERRRR